MVVWELLIGLLWMAGSCFLVFIVQGSSAIGIEGLASCSTGRTLSPPSIGLGIGARKYLDLQYSIRVLSGLPFFEPVQPSWTNESQRTCSWHSSGGIAVLDRSVPVGRRFRRLKLPPKKNTAHPIVDGQGWIDSEYYWIEYWIVRGLYTSDRLFG